MSRQADELQAFLEKVLREDDERRAARGLTPTQILMSSSTAVPPALVPDGWSRVS